ncbi:conserved hypothetical protein [Leishmania mexicana MHOM/GT/2001/U1103]|uniref:Ankyrin repeat protein n=1 Tax=Leishmania mexicana (strain MHOM/GT/2001/U1103) TaxID=929439 RepID=E9AS64_LEIMU|nr:conserved hypothetical protein [Leishmania mexicana MHOM/GT/2001/U1103]CBZ25785.1 conserved hypothetical protein [Leishmania mexicana MHOM/GT/2001/U1103]
MYASMETAVKLETAPTMASQEPGTVRCTPQRPLNAALQAEAITYLMHEREADASAALSESDLHSLAMRREQPLVPPELLMELKGSEQAGASLALPEKLNPCTCTAAAFDAWLRAVVKSIPSPAEAADAVQRGNCRGSRTIHGRAKSGGVTGVSRQQALYRVLEMLEAAARLLQRHAVLCRDRNRLLHAYYDALEEDIYQHATAVSTSTAAKDTVHPTAETQLQQLLLPEQHKFSPFHYHLRFYKRGVPLQHYTQEKEKLQSRLEKVYYVLLKLEEVEGLSNSILVEGQATSLLSQQQWQGTDDVQGGSTKAGSMMRTNVGKTGIGAGSSADSHGALTLTGGGARGDGASRPAMNGPTSQFSRRLVGMEWRVRHLRRQLRLPRPVSGVTSRLRNELILSFSARVLALREPAPFTSEMYVTSAASPSPQAAPQPPVDAAHHQSSHSISAFVEWYVQRVMDPLAISQLLSIVPREYVVTTTCRLVYACEAHASLRTSRALPDLGPVLLRAVAEGRVDAVAQLLLSSSVSYGSVLSHPVDCHTCFFAGLLGGQLDVLTRLVEQQSWHVSALHVLLFMGAPWNTAAAPTAVMSSRGCHVYQQALVERVQTFLSVAEQVLAARSQEPTYKLPLSLEENSMGATGVSTIAGGADYEADESALAALRKAQLLDVSAEGEKLLATLACFLGSTASSASIHDDALRGERHRSQPPTHSGRTTTAAIPSFTRSGGLQKKAEDASDADDDDITGSAGVSALSALPMASIPRAAPVPPPVFLNGTLHRLQLFLAVRNAMLQYERQRQDSQWETLLGKVKARPNSGDGTSSAVASTTQGLGSSANNSAWLHTKAPPLLQGSAAANPRTDHGEAPLASAVTAPSSFAHILQQHQLDALTAVAVCPLRCQMCPAFTTPLLQRVDAWSYGPLQPTTAITAALGTARDPGSEGGAPQSSRKLISLAAQMKTLIGIGQDDCRPDENLRDRLSRSLSSLSLPSRPITALLMRSDAAIDMTASSWYVHATTSQANFVEEEHMQYNSSSNSSALNIINDSTGKCNVERQTARGSRLHGLMNPWQGCSATGSLMSALPFRYSFSMPLEDVRRAAQDAKQRRALRTLYGSSAAGAADKSISDHDDDGDGSDDHHPRGSGVDTAAENLASLFVHRAPPPPAKPSFYYEVQMSVEYLVAMYAADYLGAAPPAIGSEALAHGASSPLSEDAMHRLCENCVVVGLCNPITAAQANGCTHSPSQPYVVTHLGHEWGAGGAAQDKERGGSGSGAWSAGVSVSVIAHEKVTASRLRSTCATAHTSPATAAAAVVEPGAASIAPSDYDTDTDVLYLGVWKHQRNSVCAITAMQTPLHDVDGDAADVCANVAPVYLRLELPRWSHPAPEKAAGTAAAQDAPRHRAPAANGNSVHAAETNASAAAATAATTSTNMLMVPLITRACRDDVTRAVAKAQQQQQQQQAEAAQTTASNQASERTRKSRRSATSLSPPATPFPSLPRVRCEVAATLVLGLLFDPSACTLRLRLNNYTDFEEITLGLQLGSVAEATAATTSAPPPPPALQSRLYPAATLSLNDCGWRSWCDHQTRKWAKQQQQQQQQGAQPTGLTSGKGRGERAQGEYSALPPLASTPSSSLSVSNAVLRFNFDAAELLLGPPPPRQAVRVTSADATVPARKAAHMSHQQRRVSEPIGAPSRTPQPIALLDSTVKFTEMLSLLTDVSLLAATKQSGDKNQRQQQLPSLGHGDDVAAEDEKDEVDGVDATKLRGAAPPAHPSPLLIGSRDRRTHVAMMQVQRLLNTPGGGATGTTAGSSSVFNSRDPADIFYPPVRIYRHSCHCPPHELYPLPSSSSPDAADKDDVGKRSRRTLQCRRRLGNRRVGLSSVGEAPSLSLASVYWHDIIPENARLTPLCAALASRQRTMAYVIATHPLTCFCNLTADEESACDASVRQQQPQQRRAALYAACALGYMEVVQVLLERIPVEELLSYFGLIIESEARAALQRCYTVASTVFLRNYQLRSLATQSSSSSPSSADCVDGSATVPAAQARNSGGTAAATSAPAAPYLSNESQRALLDASAIYSSSRFTYTPLHVALLGVMLDNGDQDEEGVEEASCVDVDTDEARMCSLNARLSKQTACVTVLLNGLYDLLCVASASNTTARKAQNTAELAHPPHSTKSHGREEDVLGSEAQARRASSAGQELLVDALNLQSPTGETALLVAVRHNNVAVALRLLKLGAHPACVDRVTRLLSLELACANRCSPIAEALLQSHNGGGAVYATSPVLLNHAGIATALCWCAINNMPAIMQRLLECGGIDVDSGFEGSSPLHLAIAFGSEAAALTLLNGSQPRKTATISARKNRGGRADAPPAVPVVAATAPPDTKTASLAAKHLIFGSSERGAAAPSASTARPTEAVSAVEAHRKPFMDVNILHERTHCTPLHLACERGQLRIIRSLLHSWHAQLNISAAYTNYTPLLAAVANGQEEAALRILEYSKDELRRGRAVLDLCAIDQHNDTALHLAASRGLNLAVEYMLIQFSEEEVARLVALHPTLAASPAYLTATSIVPLHAVNKQGKTALLVAVQHDQADTAELLVSMLIDSVETRKVGDAAAVFGGGGGPKSPTAVTDAEESLCSALEAAAASAPSQVGGPLIEGTCMALHQAHRKHLDSVVQMMLSAPPSLFPCTAAFRNSVQLYKEQQADGRRSMALLRSESCDGDVCPTFLADASTGPVPASERNENASQRSPAMVQDRGSFVRILLTRAAGPSISPNDALRILLRGFALPELCVYLSEVAAESAAVGLQRGTAMAHAELLIGYLQEHAGSVVAPTRAVLFCRDVWLCLQQWMVSEASADRERVAVSRAHHALSSRTIDFTHSQLPVGIEKGSEHRQKQQQQSEPEETPMGWLCRMLLVPKSDVGSRAHGKTVQPQSSLPASAPSSSALSADASSAAQEAEHYHHALEATLNRKTLSLEVARMIRLYGRSHGGARAIEEIKSIVAAYVRVHSNALAVHVRLTTAAVTAAAAATSTTLSSSSSSKHSSFSVRTRSRVQSVLDVVEQHAIWNRDSTVDLDATDSETPDRSSIDVIGNEPLFTTPMGFTVLQLAATLSLPEVVTFLVDTYKLNPLYAPAQGMYTCVAQSTAPPPVHRPKEGTAKEEAARVRNVLVRTVRAVVGVASPCAGRGDYGGGNGSIGKSREDDGLWICWTPYRLAVRSGNLHTVKTLLLTGSGATPAVAEVNPRELCDTSTSPRLSYSDRHVEDSVAVGGAGATVATATSSAASLVDYKEPAWLDPYQRTALQETIVVATTGGSGASGSDSLVDSLTFTAPAGSSSSSAATRTAPSLSEMLALVHLLLRHGAQPNGLFDATGSDAWLLAMAGSGAAGLPITHYSYAANCKRRPYSAGSEVSFSLLSLTGVSASATTSLALTQTTAGEAAGQRCVDLLLRFRAPLLGCAPATLRCVDTHLDGRHLVRQQESAESECFNEQLLRYPRRLLHQWRRLPCMRLAPNRAAAAGFARRGRRAAGTAGNTHDGSGSDEDNDAAGKDGDGAVAHGYSVFEQADALCAQYEKVQQTLYPSSAMAIPRGSGGVGPCTPSPQATALATKVSFASLLTITSAEVTRLPRAVDLGSAVTLNRGVLAGGCVSETDSVAGRETEASPLTPSFSPELLKTRLITALRLCYRVVLLYTCVEYTPLQLPRLVRAFGAAAIPVSARHPLSGDSIATRLLRKMHAHLLAGTNGSGGGGDGSTSSTPREEPESDATSIIMRDADDMSELPMSVLKEPPCTGDPTANAETRALVDTCVALVHMLRDAALRLPSPPSAPQSQAAAVAAGHALRSVLFQPSCDGETALSLAARIAHAPLISVLVQSGAAVTSASHSRRRGGDESWRCSHTTCSVPRRGDGSDTEAGGEDGAGVYDVSGIPVTSQCSLKTSLADVVVRVLLATRVYYPAHEIGTVRALLTHMPNETARRAFLRGVYPNIHPLPALQLAMDNVNIASDFLTGPKCMNALWTNLMYAHFTGQLDTAVRTTAKAWSELLHVVLPGAPAVPIYLVMCAAVREEVSAGELEASRSGVRAQNPQPTLSPPRPLASSSRSSSTVKKRSKERTVPLAMSNWSHIVRRTNLFLQLMAMSAAETLMSKSSKPSSHMLADAKTLSSTAATASGSGQRIKTTSSLLHEVPKKDSFAALTDVGEPPSHGLSGTLLWDTIELAVRYDDKDMLRHLLQLRLPDIVLKHISNIQSQQQALSSTGTFGGTYSSMGVSARAMEAVSTTILGSYPSFAGVSTTSQAALVLERLQRLLWCEALQECHVDLLAVAAGSVATLRFLYTSSPPEVRAQMAPMRYDRVDVKSGMPEGVSPAPDIAAPAAAAPAGAEELMGSVQRSRKSSSARVASGVMSPSAQAFVYSSEVETNVKAVDHQLTKTPFSASAASTTPSADGVTWLAAPTPETPTSRASSAAKRTSAALGVDTVETPDERSLTLPLTNAPLLQPKAGEDKEEEESAAAVADAELRFMESCVQNGRRRLAAGEEQRRCVTAVTWGLGAAACAVKLPMAQSSARAVSSSSADAAEATTAPGTSVEVQPRYTPALPQPPRPPAQRRITLDGKVGDVVSAKGSHKPIADAERTAARRVVQRQGRTKTSLPTKASAAAKEASGPAPSSPTSPAVMEPEPVYFMYLQLDWALHSTRLLRSPRPSSATLETIMFLLDQRVALSVPVLDLFLAGTVAPSNADARQELALGLRYQTRTHRDTLLHLLVFHDQCQLAEYYLEYCHFWFVSNELDPEPVSGRPGRFPIDQPPASPDGDFSEDDLHDDDDHRRSGVGYMGHDKQKRSTHLAPQLRHRSRDHSSSGYAETVPREFLRCMLRVNAHGLTAFDYAYTPAMLQLLEWYGCVPPTYRPNPHAFRRVVFLDRGGHGDMREAYTLAGNMGDCDSSEAADRRWSASTRTSMARHQREVLRFFPVPRLVLATDNFVALLDPTGTELASTVGSVATAQARAAAAGTADGKSRSNGNDVDEGLAKDELLVSTRTQPLQLTDRRIDAIIGAERRQLQASWRRHHQQERAKALLFEQVAAQSQALVVRRGGKSGGADESVRENALPYLTRTVTAHRRQQWELQRHPPCSKMTLWHNALEAQRLSVSAFTAASSRGQLKRRAKADARGSDIFGAGILPILLSEEVSLLHLGLCSFEDELVRLYGELHTASASTSAAGNEDTSGAARAHHKGSEEVGAMGDGDHAASVLSAYSRLLLPPSVTDKPETHPQQDHEAVKQSSGVMFGDTPLEMGNPNSTPRTKASRTGHTVLPHVSFPGGSIGGALSPAQQGTQLSSVSTTKALVAASQNFGSCGGVPAPPPRLSQMDVVFLLECQQFVVYPLSMPSSADAVGVIHDGGDDSYDESSKPRSSVRGTGGLSVSVGNTSRAPSDDEGNAASPRLTLGKGGVGVSELPAVIQRCTGGSIGTDERHVNGNGSGAPRQRALAPATTTRDTTGRSFASPHRSSVRREHEHKMRNAPPSDLPLLRSLLARKAADDLSSELIDVAVHRYEAALLVSLTPMLLSGISGDGAAGARVSAAATMKNLAVKLMDTRWKQFGSRPIISGTNTDATTTATEAVALLNVPPFALADAPALYPHRASLSTAPAADEHGSVTPTTALGSAAARVPTVIAARLEEWVARRWPLQGQASPSLKLHRAGGRADVTSSRSPPTTTVKAFRQENKDENTQDRDGVDEDGYDDESAALPVLDQIEPVGGVATAAQQVLMRALLKRFTAATGAQLSEQMGLVITPNYDVVEVGDTAAALRDIEAKFVAPAAARQKRR